MDLFSGIMTVLIASATGALWRLDKRSSVTDARLEIVLQEIKGLRLGHKERLDDHESRLRALEKPLDPHR